MLVWLLLNGSFLFWFAPGFWLLSMLTLLGLLLSDNPDLHTDVLLSMFPRTFQNRLEEYFWLLSVKCQSDDEKRARLQLVQTCRDIVSDFEDMEEFEDDDE